MSKNMYKFTLEMSVLLMALFMSKICVLSIFLLLEIGHLSIQDNSPGPIHVGGVPLYNDVTYKVSHRSTQPAVDCNKL